MYFFSLRMEKHLMENVNPLNKSPISRKIGFQNCLGEYRSLPKKLYSFKDKTIFYKETKTYFF